MPAKPTRPSRAAKPVTDTIANSDKGSRVKAETAAERTVSTQPDDIIPRAHDGFPLTMIEMSASELIPTGHYANISVGPGRIRHWIDSRDPDPITDAQLANIAKALNKIADTVEIDVIAVQRNLMLENMQQQLSGEDEK